MNLTDFELEKDIQSEHNQSGLVMTNQNNDVVCAREGEDILQVRFRVNRLFAIGMEWYFATREGVDQGPFLSKEGAEFAIAKYIDDMQV